MCWPCHIVIEQHIKDDEKSPMEVKDEEGKKIRSPQFHIWPNKMDN